MRDFAQTAVISKTARAAAHKLEILSAKYAKFIGQCFGLTPDCAGIRAGSISEMKTLHRAKGLGHDLVVTQQGNTLTLWSHSGVRHTVLDLGAPHLPGLEYARNTLLALAFSPHAKSILLLGLGGGSIYHMLRHVRPAARIEAVEIDPAVLELARRFFQVGAAANFHVHLEDAAQYLEACVKEYDVIIFDAYVGDQLPAQFVTLEFFNNARKHLTADGVLVLNWMAGNPGQYRRALEYIGTALGHAWVLRGYRARNTLLFASPRPVTRQTLMANAADIEREAPSIRAVARLVRYLQPA
jgi:spermidine synthase